MPRKGIATMLPRAMQAKSTLRWNGPVPWREGSPIHLYRQEEWQKQGTTSESPCQDGYGGMCNVRTRLYSVLVVSVSHINITTRPLPNVTANHMSISENYSILFIKRTHQTLSSNRCTHNSSISPEKVFAQVYVGTQSKTQLHK